MIAVVRERHTRVGWQFLQFHCCLWTEGQVCHSQPAFHPFASHRLLQGIYEENEFSIFHPEQPEAHCRHKIRAFSILNGIGFASRISVIFKPSIFSEAEGRVPRQNVGSKSIEIIGVLQVFPAGICPGQRATIGTRTPPSNVVSFPHAKHPTDQHAFHSSGRDHCHCKNHECVF